MIAFDVDRDIRTFDVDNDGSGRCGGFKSFGGSAEGGFDSLGDLRTVDREHPPVRVRHGMARVVVLSGDIHRGGRVDHVEKIVCLFRGIVARGDDTRGA